LVTEYRSTTNKQMKNRIQDHYKQTKEIQNTGTLQTNKGNTEYRSTKNIQMKYRIQEHYKQTDEIQIKGAL
jgi:ferritin-like metal-binding protein YciE